MAAFRSDRDGRELGQQSCEPVAVCKDQDLDDCGDVLVLHLVPELPHDAEQVVRRILMGIDDDDELGYVMNDRDEEAQPVLVCLAVLKLHIIQTPFSASLGMGLLADDLLNERAENVDDGDADPA
jgi:hypothetical protein